MLSIIGSLLLVIIISYLWGSIPSGYWMGKILRGREYDIREFGSHKTGATNVQRTLGTVPAIIVFIVDLSKGFGPVLLTMFIPQLNNNGWGPTCAGLAALLGHCYPVFINFKGGRGVLTGAGALLAISPFSFLIAAITTFSTIGISRYVSLGSLVGCLTVFLCGIIFYLISLANPHFFAAVNLARLVFLVVAPVLVAIFHRDNIGRLVSGKERKLGQKVTTESVDIPNNVQI